MLKEIVGRLEDVVVGPDGRRMVRFHGIFVGLPNVTEGQVVQRTLDDVDLLPEVVQLRSGGAGIGSRREAQHARGHA